MNTSFTNEVKEIDEQFTLDDLEGYAAYMAANPVDPCSMCMERGYHCDAPEPCEEFNKFWDEQENILASR